VLSGDQSEGLEQVAIALSRFDDKSYGGFGEEPLPGI